MSQKILTGYHGTTKEKSESILKQGFKISKSQEQKYEWLGDGIYFWDDIFYAVQWNIINMEKNYNDKNEKNLMNYAIIKSKIIVNKSKLFDISSPEGSIIYSKLKKKLEKKLIESGSEKLVEKLKKQSDKFWINILEDNGFFKEFDVIMAEFKNKKRNEKYKDDILLNVQKQICVKNQKCIITSKLYRDKKRILDLFSIIISRRLVKNE
jgi:hypothetical protein